MPRHANCSSPLRHMIHGIPAWLLSGAIVAVFVLPVFLLMASGNAAAAAPGYWTFDLLRVAFIRDALLWRPFRFLAQAVFILLFAIVLATGLFGNQSAGANAATVLTWTYWWILLVLLTMVLGKAWCYVCPWDAIARSLERLSLWGRGRPLSANLRWPLSLRNLYPAAGLFLLLTWLELGYGVTTSPALTAVLGLGMFLLTFLPALLFERSAFCRYGCLVGRISGLYALFAPIEIRARDKDVCRTGCATKDCYHGNERGNPCPTSQFLGGMSKNTYCVMCGECIYTCPHDNVALNVRPFASDLLKPSPVRADEAAMVVIMLSMSTFHGITMTPFWNDVVDAIERALGLPFLPAFTIGMAGFLTVLASGYLAFVGVSHVVAHIPAIDFRQLAIRYAYAFLPIALFYHFAHNSMHFFIEGRALLPVLSDPFGWSWDLFGTARTAPAPLFSMNVTWIVMVVCILTGYVWSLFIASRVACGLTSDRAWALRSLVPVVVCMVVYAVLSLWIVAQPMEMRTGL